MKFVLLFLVFLLLSFVLGHTDVSSEDEDVPLATLIVFKQFVTSDMVEGQPFRVNYTIYNAGDGEASNIQLIDRLSEEHFTVISGDFVAEWERLAP